MPRRRKQAESPAAEPTPEPTPIAEPLEAVMEQTWAEKVKPYKPQFDPVPPGFHNTDRYQAAGIRVNKNLAAGIAAIQFSDDARPDADEKLAMQGKGVTYNERSRQWERQDREHPGGNLIEIKQIARDLALNRERCIEVFGR